MSTTIDRSTFCVSNTLHPKIIQSNYLINRISLLEIKDATDTARDASYLDLHLEIKDTTDTARSASHLDLTPRNKGYHGYS